MTDRTQYTEQQKAQFREEFARRRRCQWLAIIPLIPVFIALRFGNTNLQPIVPIIGFAYIVDLLFFSFRNWRCPACDRYLGKSGNPAFCPQCGVELRLK